MRFLRLLFLAAFFLGAAFSGAGAQAARGNCEPCGKAPSKHIVLADGHPLTVWAKRPTSPQGAILLLHGRRWSALPNFDLRARDVQRSVMDDLAANGYAVYALDMRGYGATPRDSSGWLTPDRAAEDVAAVLEWIAQQQDARSKADDRRPVLLGYSRGSATAILTAQRHPDKLSALIIYAFPVDIDSLRPVAADPVRPPRVRNTREGAAEDFLTSGAVTSAVREAFVAAAIAADPVTADWAKLYQFNAMDPAALHLPTLLLEGSRDPRAAGTGHSRLFARLGTQDRTWVILPGGDHAAHIENSHDAFIHAITSFLARPRQAAPIQ